MFDTIFEVSQVGVLTLSPVSVLISSVVSVVLGIIIAFVTTRDGKSTKGFAVSTAMLPLVVQAVIMAVNGNLGYGVAVMGAFGLVRFRSVAGSARDISTVFLTVAVGLLNAMGYVAYAVALVAIALTIISVLSNTAFGENNGKKRYLKVTMPESLDYEGVFDEVFEKYASNATLEKVKTVNLGSMFEICYNLTLKGGISEKEFIDEIRTRNGNLTVVMSRYSASKDEL